MMDQMDKGKDAAQYGWHPFALHIQYVFVSML